MAILVILGLLIVIEQGLTTAKTSRKVFWAVAWLMLSYLLIRGLVS